MNRLRVAIAGATGRMGRALLQHIAAAPDLQLAAAVTLPDDPQLGQDAALLAGLAPAGVLLGTEVAVACDVLIEFTSPRGCAGWAGWCAARRVPLVSGTTGLTADEHAAVNTAAREVPIVWSPNMSTGVNVLLALVADLAARLDAAWDIEIIEAHHRRKADAPSGTAQALVEAACEARGVRAAEVVTHGRAGLTGARPTGQVGVHAVRMGALIGEHEVHFTSTSESLTLRHRAFSRDTFAEGALRAARWLQGRAPALYTMRDVLFS